MNTKLLLGGAIALAALAALPGSANAQANQGGTPAVAAAGSPIIVPGAYFNGVLNRWDPLANTIVIDGVTYPVGADVKIAPDLSVGEQVDVTYVTEHYGRAARKVIIGAKRYMVRDEGDAR
jgi:hypothetical protein